jgi:glycosyltransferase involved in cell wall biosynthesis
MTPTYGKANIEQFLAARPTPRLTVVYVEPPEVSLGLGRFRAPLQCIFWQSRALKAALHLDRTIGFDLVHHVTWGSLHIGSKLWRLRKPFIFGPIGGGQVAPPRFSRYFRGGRMMELVRSVFVRHFTGALFAAKSTVLHSDIVLVSNEETRNWVQRLGARRVEFMLDIAIAKDQIASSTPTQRQATTSQSDPKRLRVLWVGRLLARKGLLLALEAIAQVDRRIDLSCTIIGDGPQSRYLARWVDRLGLRDRVKWKGQVPWSEALAAYDDHNVFLFTSLRDSVGSQLMEAMARGNAIITLDHHGAHVAVPPSAGIKVPVTVPDETVAQLARAIERLATEPETLSAMQQKALDFAKEHTWERRIERASELYKSTRHGLEACTTGFTGTRPE